MTLYICKNKIVVWGNSLMQQFKLHVLAKSFIWGSNTCIFVKFALRSFLEFSETGRCLWVVDPSFIIHETWYTLAFWLVEVASRLLEVLTVSMLSNLLVEINKLDEILNKVWKVEWWHHNRIMTSYSLGGGWDCHSNTWLCNPDLWVTMVYLRKAIICRIVSEKSVKHIL